MAWIKKDGVADADLLAGARGLLAASEALIGYVRHRYPGEKLHCPHMQRLAAAIDEARGEG